MAPVDDSPVATAPAHDVDVAVAGRARDEDAADRLEAIEASAGAIYGVLFEGVRSGDAAVCRASPRSSPLCPRSFIGAEKACEIANGRGAPAKTRRGAGRGAGARRSWRPRRLIGHPAGCGGQSAGGALKG